MANMRRLILILILAVAASPARSLEPGQMMHFIEEVETLRGLRFERSVEHRVLARANLKSFLAAQIETELPIDVDTYMATLEALKLIDPSVSMDDLLDLYDAQVLAFYDPVGHIYYSLDQPPADVVLPPVMIDAVVVHELMHALQDQRFEAGGRSVALQPNWDGALAYQSVLEGEALLVMIAYLGKSMGQSLDTFIEQDAIVDAVRQSAADAAAAPEGVPAYFLESLKFPYVEGLAFVLDLYRAGGWPAIDAVHANPPRSTEELIHPEVYRQRVSHGSAPDDDDPRPRPSDRLVETVLGEFHWAFLLGGVAGEGWESDLVSVRHGDGGWTVLVDSIWDDEHEAEEFEHAYRELLDREEAPNRIVARTGARVKAAYGADATSTRLFAGDAVAVESANGR